MLPLPLAWAHETRLSTKAGIPELWDNAVLVISGTGADTVCSFSPQCGQEGPVSVLGCCTSTYYFADGPHGPRHGSGSRPRLPSQYFRDLGACLRRGTAN